MGFPAKRTIIHLTPTSGLAYTIPEGGDDIVLSLEHPAAIASMSLAFPTGFEGQEIKLMSAKPVTSVTLTAGTVTSAPGAFASGDCMTFTCAKTGSSTWSRAT